MRVFRIGRYRFQEVAPELIAARQAGDFVNATAVEVLLCAVRSELSRDGDRNSEEK